MSNRGRGLVSQVVVAVLDTIKQSIYRLFHRRFEFELVPNRQLDPVGDNRWRSTGGDPHFMMRPLGGVFPAGWINVKTTLHRTDKGQKLKLYYDNGWGMNETAAVPLRVAADGTVEQLVKLPRGIKAMRWDPIEAPGEFSQGSIAMSRISLMSRIAFELKALKGDPDGPKGFDAFFRRLFLRHERLYKEVHQLKTRLAGGTYQMWIKAHRLRGADRRAIARHVDSFALRPTISVLMPVYNTPADVLREAIESVQAQLYPNWELCVADDASTAPHVRDVLEKFRRADSRIKVEYRQVNGHISASSNSALALAQGDFIALLDHDDMLSEQALYQVVAELNKYPETDVVYTDEDKIDSDPESTRNGERYDPHFKSSWNPDLLYSQNYVSHLGVYRTDLVRSVGGFREGFEGSQDFDLLLRCIAARGEARVRHIPVILYHWRAGTGSTALDEEEKSYATEHGIKALKEHFRSRGIAGVEVTQARFPTTYHVRFPVPEPAPKVSILIPTKNHHEILRVCIDSIREKTTYPNYEIVVVDNQSSDPDTLRYFDEVTKTGVRVIKYDKPFNYSAINNFAVEHSDGEVVVLLNNDIEVITPDWLTEMVALAMRPDVGAVGAKLYYGDNTIQHAGVIVGLGGVAGHSHKHLPRDNPGYFRRLCVTQNLSAVTGACLVVRRDSYLKVGGLESEELTVAFNDVDFCLKLGEIGLRNVWTPHAELFHHESASRGPEDSPEKILRFQQEIAYMQRRWGSRLRNDPYYSPILTLDWENFTPDYRVKPRKPWLDQD